MERYDRATTIMYIDPPYPENKCNYAHNMRTWEEHQELADRLAHTKCKWILSSYDRPQVRKLYAGYQIYAVTSFSGMKTTKHGSERVLNQEVLITNYLASVSQAYTAGQRTQLTLLDPLEPFDIA